MTKREKFYRGAFYFLMALASTSLLPAIYLLKSRYVLWNTKYSCINKPLDVITYLGVPLVMSIVALFWMKSQAKDSINNDIKVISPVNHEYLPVYLGYIFVSLSMPNPSTGVVDWTLLVIVYMLICLFVTCSKTLCFNPLFILFGYGYYQVTTNNGVKVFVLTLRSIRKAGDSPTFPHLRKVNEMVYIDTDED